MAPETASVDPVTDSARTLADRVCGQLIDAIVSGELPQGGKISEAVLARRYGISRGPLREAIRRLEGLGLVQRQAHVGARVVTLSKQELVDIYAVREALEGIACRLAAHAMDDNELLELEKLLQEHEQQVSQNKAYYQAAGDFDFHYRIINGSRNRRLIELLTGELYHLIRMYRYQSAQISSRPQQALADHRHIVEALKQRDADLAEILMRRHISAARRSIEEHYLEAVEQ